MTDLEGVASLEDAKKDKGEFSIMEILTFVVDKRAVNGASREKFVKPLCFVWGCTVTREWQDHAAPQRSGLKLKYRFELRVGKACGPLRFEIHKMIVGFGARGKPPAQRSQNLPRKSSMVGVGTTVSLQKANGHRWGGFAPHLHPWIVGRETADSTPKIDNFHLVP